MPSIALPRDISRVIRQVRPQRALIQSPERNWVRVGASHPVHLAAGAAAIAADPPGRALPFAHPALLADEGLAEGAVAETWPTAHPDSNHAVDITDVIDTDIGRASGAREPDRRTGRPRVPAARLYGQYAMAAGLADGRLAERFFVVSTA